MSWKDQIQLLDLDDNTALEASCKSCGYSWYVPATHKDRQERQLFLSEFEARLTCPQRTCPQYHRQGKIRIALASNNDTEGFQGGLT